MLPLSQYECLQMEESSRVPVHELDKWTREICDMCDSYMRDNNPRDPWLDSAMIVTTARRMRTVLSEVLEIQEQVYETTITAVNDTLRQLAAYISVVSAPRPRTSGLRL